MNDTVGISGYNVHCQSSEYSVLYLQWLTTHEPSEEHELTGLRDNFNPRARWRAAIAGARALHRFGSHGSSASSAGWRSRVNSDLSDDDDDDETGYRGSGLPVDHPGENEYVKVTAPEASEDEASHRPPSSDTNQRRVVQHDPEPPQAAEPSDTHILKHEKDTHLPLHQKVPTPLQAMHQEQEHKEQEHISDAESELAIPGSFDVRPHEHKPEGHRHHFHLPMEGGLSGLLRRLHLRS